MKVNAPDAMLDRLVRRATWPNLPARVLVACSGGADSLALLALAVHAGFDVVAGHVDHGLRADAANDLRVVEYAAGALGVRAVSRSVAVDGRSNLEARARDARYAALSDLASEHDCEWIFTGHTLDDQAETVLLATLRGSGVNGLAGIPARRGAIVRPLLEVRRHETRELCLVLGWAPVEDPMNLDPAFTRVWLRREVLPALERGMDRDLAVVLARQADIARADAEVLDALAAALLDECVAGLPGSGLAVDRLLRAPQAIARRALRRWLPVAVGSEAIDSLLGVAAGAGRAVDIGSGRRVRRSAGLLIVELVSASTVDSLKEVLLSVPGTARFGELVIRTRVDAVSPIAWPDGRAVCVLDADVVGEEVVVRSPASGERFRPIGLTGTKTVAAARADAGITVDRRHDLPVVARVDGEIVWVLGYRGAHPARVTSNTRRYCWMTVEPSSGGPL